MLCLDEGTPVVLAICLVGSVLLIIGGSFWGKGNTDGDRPSEVAGIVMFSISLMFLMLGVMGCLCNRFFCTPDRKSRIALRLYGSRPPRPTADDDDDVAPQSAERDKDWEEYAGPATPYRSFRSGRNSKRNLRSRTSLRRDRVMPDQGAPQSKPSSPPPPPPPPPRPQQQDPQTYLSANHTHSGGGIGHINNGTGVPVPVEYSATPPGVFGGHNISQQNHHGEPVLNHYQQLQQEQQHHLHQAQVQQQQHPLHAPLNVTPHVPLPGRASGFRSPPPPPPPPPSNAIAGVSKPVLV